MIELSSKVWGLSIPDTLVHMAERLPGLRELDLGVHGHARYQKMIDCQKKTRVFLTTNIGKFASSQVLMPLKLRLLAHNQTPEQWATRGGQFFVAATRQDVDELIGNGPLDSVFHGWGRQSSQWKEVLVIPYSDLPGRISALQFFSVQDDVAAAFRYRSLLPSFEYSPEHAPGIALFEAIDNSHPRYGNDLFVFTDALLALRTQIDQLRHDGGNLPIVAIYPESVPTTYLHDHCPSRRIIFWAPELSLQLFRHAKAADGWIADHRPGEEIHHFLRRLTTVQWMSLLRKSARRWEDVLEEHLSIMPTVEMSAFVLRLNWNDDDLERFIKGCLLATRERLQSIYDSRRQNRRVVVNGTIVVETGRGWQLARNDEVISDATFRLDQVIHYEDGRHFYSGRAFYKGQTLNFTAPGKEFDQAPLSWLRNLCIHKNIGVPTFVKPWQVHAITISQKFHEPKTVPGLDRCGWAERYASFMTSDYAIELGGNVRKHELPSPDELYKVSLPLPSAFVKSDIDLLGKPGYDSELAWAVAGCILHDVLARVYRYDTSGLLLSGTGTGNAVELSRSIGCPIRIVDAQTAYWPGIDAMTAAEQKASWPLLLPNHLTHTAKPQSWLRLGQHNSIVTVDWVPAHVYMIGARWKYLDIGHTLLDSEVIQSIRRAVSAFLRAVAYRRLLLWQSSGAGTLKYVFANLMAWFDEIGGNSEAIDRAYDLVRFDEEGLPASIFFELLAFLFTEGRITSARSDCVPSAKQRPCLLYLSENPDAIWVPKPGVNQALTGRMRQPMLDLNAVSMALANDNKLLDEFAIAGVPGWVVPRKAWEMGIKLWNRANTRTFGVVR